MKKNKKKNRLDFSTMGELAHNPFAELGQKFGIEAKEAGRPKGKDEPTQQKAQLLIRKERRKGQKWVTVVYHLEAEAGALVKTLKKRFATGGGLDDGNIVLQGDHVQALAAWFKSQGYRTREG